MKTPCFVISGCLFLATTAVPAAPLGTTFTYQGRLGLDGNPAQGPHLLTFSAFDAATAGTRVAGPRTNLVAISNGLFTTELDFGANVFTGQDRWLEIGVLSGAVHHVLMPRQRLAPTPNAIFALNSGGVPDGSISAPKLAPGAVGNATLQNGAVTGAKIAAGQVVKSLNGLFDAVTLAAGPNITLTPSGNSIEIASSSATAWQLTGNGGTGSANFLGTTDNQPLELRANGTRGLKLEYIGRSSGFPILFTQRAMNVIGGYWGNSIASNVIGATIAGGGDEAGSFLFPNFFPNTVNGDFGSVGGGYNNTAGYGATVPGGYNNSATGTGSFAAGRRSHVAHDGSFMWCDGSQDAFSTAHNQFGVLAQGGLHFWHGSEGVNLDQFNLNDGAVAYSLRFGVGSGEAIGSKRTAGGNQWGLDFYTAYANRMSIANWGGVGINTTAPEQQLDVNGWYMQVRGAGNEKAYLGGDGSGADVQIGSFNVDVVNVAAYNPSRGEYMNMFVRSLTITGGADLAEPFQVSQEEILPGAVMVIDEENPGHLKQSTRAYDTRVAGVVSGAGGVLPGIQMSQHGVLEGTQNIALTGRVYVQVDASFGAVRPGDLLTTSETPGYAMKVGDPARAQGAILGKAMTSLKEGKGLVLTLVTLQ